MNSYEPTPIAREVAAILRAQKGRLGRTQAELADAAGVSQSHMSKMLRGVAPIDIDELDRLAARLETTVEAIIAEATVEARSGRSNAAVIEAVHTGDEDALRAIIEANTANDGHPISLDAFRKQTDGLARAADQDDPKHLTLEQDDNGDGA